MSSDTTVPIAPTEKVETHTITSVDFRFFDYVLFSKVSVMCCLRDIKGRVIANEVVRVDGEDFKKWGNDDQYIVDLVLSKLGLSKPTIQSISEVQVPVEIEEPVVPKPEPEPEPVIASVPIIDPEEPAVKLVVSEPSAEEPVVGITPEAVVTEQPTASEPDLSTLSKEDLIKWIVEHK